MRRIWKRLARIHLLVAATVVAGLALVGAGQAGAATITVNCTADPNALASALASANDGDTLAITGTCKGTFEIGHSLTLAGSGGATLDGQGAGTVVTVDAGRTVAIGNLTITGGSSSASTAVGGIENFGTLTLTNSSVSGNSASSSFVAIGGIDNEGTLTLSKSSVNGNSGSVAPGLAFGGILSGGSLTLMQSTVSGNSATATGSSGTRVARAGIENTGTMTITSSYVTQNTASAPGNAVGGILNGVNQDVPGSGMLTVSKSTVSGNSASSDFATAVGGIGNGGGQVTLSNSPVSGNSASSVSGAAVGGISNRSPGTVTLTKSQVVNNIPINCDFSDPACALP
jgi:hypothetical protein